ncbi:D-(-)-3-hydroxybutyrate oligomer hydrolase [Kangiella sp. TOML190]|uniref:D-(-)-3-hydroxybutyrate oligomer hydrolase n=1 Tax=Kangiella sp. TOML190 TaxID=2931351 RepID=UPI00203DB682|nr:D-(-)-3-hydroxybutyrate oligomer hydrolase [Kangiella sp. TOML190]
MKLKFLSKNSALLSSCLLACLALSACQDNQNQTELAEKSKITASKAATSKPAFNSQRPIHYVFSEQQNSEFDLLSAGLSLAQLRSVTPPSLADSEKPSPLELRQLAYYHNIRALMDLSAAGGFKDSYGLAASDKLYGDEFLTYSSDKSGQLEATYLVQIPENFNQQQACLVVSASSGSRGIYGAVGVVGFWALHKGCAVAYTDKGTGSGFYFPQQQAGYDIQGNLVKLALNPSADPNKIWQPPSPKPSNSPNSESALKPSNQDKKQPRVVATKHAHSKSNLEKDWGQFVINATHAGLYFLNQHFPEQNYKPNNTLILAAGISNAGGAALRAVELDRQQLFDAVVVGEPNLAPALNHDLIIADQTSQFITQGKPLLNYNADIALYQGCALLSQHYAKHSFAMYIQFNQAQFAAQCGYLKQHGLISGKDISTQAEQSYQALIKIGLLPQALDFLPVGTSINLWNAINATYFNAYAKADFTQPICGSHFVIDNTKFNAQTQASLFATSSGVPPTAGINIQWPTQISDTDFDLSPVYQSDLCFNKTLKPNLPIAVATDSSAKAKIEASLQQITATGDLQNTPAIIIHGQADGLIHVNHSSRAYLGLNYRKEAAASQLRYYEIENAHHFDAFNALPALQSRYVPLHTYYEQALDLMWQHLTQGKALPASQRVATQTRQLKDGAIEALSMEHTPAISEKPKHPILVDKEKVSIQ